jgi:hypothetical protein
MYIKQYTDLFWKSYNLWKKVHFQLQNVTASSSW